MATSRLQVMLDVPMSVDGKFVGRGELLSRPESLACRIRFHATFDVVLVDGHSVMDTADPRYLTIVERELRVEQQAVRGGRCPLYVVIAEDASPLVGSRFIRASSPDQVWIYTTDQTPSAQVAALREAGARVSVLGGVEVDLVAVLRDLHSAGIELLLVEGDSALNARLLDLNLVDELAVCIIPFLSGVAATAWTSAAFTQPMPPLKLTLIHELDGDAVVLYYTVLHRDYHP